jgi:hypothetical protein
VVLTPNAAPAPGALAARARSVLDGHWTTPGRTATDGSPIGFTVPNAHTYPHQWLWDSAFHSIIWAHLGDADRAVAELTAAFAHQADDGFVPHLTYWSAPDQHAGLWGRRWTSAVTQPPMYGHALAELRRHRITVPAELVAAASAGLRFLLVERDRGDGRVAIVHPWESGCDDSPRWDAWYPGGRWSPAAGHERKGAWMRAVRLGPGGSPRGSDAFEVASAGFGALVAFNAAELASVAPLDDDLARRAAAVVAWLTRSWDDGRRTFADVALQGARAAGSGRAGARAAGSGRAGARAAGSGGTRVLEALLPLLVLPDDGPGVDDAFGQLHDETALGGACGPAQVHRGEAAFDPVGYWRGSAWPQLSYLLWIAARRGGRARDAAALRDATVCGAVCSGWAEHWHPDTGAGLGAIPQSWTGLAAVMAAASDGAA